MLMRDNILAFVSSASSSDRQGAPADPPSLEEMAIERRRHAGALRSRFCADHDPEEWLAPPDEPLELASLDQDHGEILLNGRVPRRIEGRKVGATIHYGQWKRRPSAIDFKKTKVIHLLRDPRGVALSQARNRIDQRIHGDRHRAHFRVGDEPPEIYEVDLEAIEKRTINIAAQQKEFTRMLRRKTVYTVTYEELTRNQSIETAPEGFARPLLDFLGVEHRRLRTTFAKSGPVPGQDVRP